MKKISLFILSFLFLGLGIHITNAQEDTSFKRSLKMEGRIMYDFNFLSAGDTYSFAGNKFRRLRIAAKGKVSESISYSLDFELTGGKVAYRNVFLRYTLPGVYGNITIGSFEEPTGLDMLTSSKYISFIERAMMTTTQFEKNNAGFRYSNQKLLDGKMGVQLAYTFNGKGSAAFQDNALYGGANFIGRITGKVIENKEKRQLVHLGVNYEYRNDEIENFSYKAFKTENSMGEKTTIASVGNLKNTSDIGFELAATFGSLSFQSEYELASIVTDIDTYKTNGYYGYVSYFITGEHRPYKKSVFGRVKPKKEFMKDGGLGAIELVARYSVMDLNGNKDLTNTDNDDYSIANITLGFNWHLTSHTRFMYNYVNADHNSLETDNNINYGNNKLVGHLVRFQIDF